MSQRKKPKILTLIFPSNYPNFKADSIFNFNRSLFMKLASRHDVEAFAAGPPDMPALGDGIPNFSFPHGVNKFEVRFDFPWQELEKTLKTVRPDICLVNMPEQAAAVSILAKEVLGIDCRIVSYVHYVPAMLSADRPMEEADVVYEASMNQKGHAPFVLLRLLEGVAASDLALICSDFGVRLLRVLAARHLSGSIALPPILKLAPPVDFEEVDSVARPTASKTPRFVYNHRLYDEYGTQKMFGLMEGLAASERPFEVLVTNPTEGRGKERSKLNPRLDANLDYIRSLPFVRQEHFSDRAAYIRALASSWAGIAPFKPHALWSMSVMDVLACDRPVLSFDIAAFREMGLPDSLLVDSDVDFETAFRELLAQGPEKDELHGYRGIASEFSRTRTAERFYDLIGEL